MSVIFELPADLAGKSITDPQVNLDICIKLGLWQNYEQWLDSKQQLTHWYNDSVLNQNPIHIKIQLGTTVFFEKLLTQFETVSLCHQFSDTDVCDHVLQITATGLDRLPIRDDTGVFVCAMLEIQQLNLMSLDCRWLLHNTFYGNDTSIQVPISTPIYPYLLENQVKILGYVFPLIELS